MQLYLLVLVVTTFVYIFPFLSAAVRAVSLVHPVPLFFSLCCAIWFVMEQINSHQLSVPRHNLSFGSRAFQFSAPRVWNSLPVSIRVSQSLPTFRLHLKTFFFQSVDPISAAHLA